MRFVATAMLLVAVFAGNALAEPGKSGRGSKNADPDHVVGGALSAEDKARLLWGSQPADRATQSPPVLEDLMTRDQIIEEFDVFAPVNPVPGEPIEETAAIPVPRTLPVDPGVLRFRPLNRIRQMVRADLYDHFDLYLYVNKAPKGVWAQQMFVYERQPDGEYRQLYRWLTSTGREKSERYFTTTPVGIYKLDPRRFYKLTHSVQWGGVAMPYAMFIDFSYSSRRSGIAIHGTSGRTENYLGHRASGGCIRLSVNNARMLYYLIKTNYGGMVPEFAFDRERGHTSKTGVLLRDENGDIVFEPGYRVLLIVDYVTN